MYRDSTITLIRAKNGRVAAAYVSKAYTRVAESTVYRKMNPDGFIAAFGADFAKVQEANGRKEGFKFLRNLSNRRLYQSNDSMLDEADPWKVTYYRYGMVGYNGITCRDKGGLELGNAPDLYIGNSGYVTSRLGGSGSTYFGPNATKYTLFGNRRTMLFDYEVYVVKKRG